MKSETKTVGILDALLKYWQLILVVVGIIVGWTIADSRIALLERQYNENKIVLDRLEGMVNTNKSLSNDFEKETLQRLSSMEAKIDFLVGQKTAAQSGNSTTIENRNLVVANISVPNPKSTENSSKEVSKKEFIPPQAPKNDNPDIHFIPSKYLETHNGATTNDFFEWYFASK